MSASTLIIGIGESPFRPASRPATRGTLPAYLDLPRANERRLWGLAIERGLVQGDTTLLEVPERWIALASWEAGALVRVRANLEADPAVLTYEVVPEDSPALALYRARQNPTRPRAPRDEWLRLASRLADSA